jgi:hypothetical protein
MAFIIFDTESGNAVSSFTNEAEALQEVRATLAEFGRDAVEPWILVARDPSGRRREIAQGEALIDLALAPAA